MDRDAAGRDVWNRRRDSPTDWWQWHEIYDEPGSPGQQRLLAVRRQIGAALAARRTGPVGVVGACAGQGRDLIPVLAERAGRPAVRARLIELDPRNAALARRAIDEAGLGDVAEVVVRDAGTTDAYADAVPIDVLLLCGVFGNISDEDVQTTVQALPSLCALDATVIWTRHRGEPDLTPTIRRWFREAGFEEQAFDSPGPGTASFSVGAARLVAEPRHYEAGRRLFSFTR